MSLTVESIYLRDLDTGQAYHVVCRITVVSLAHTRRSLRDFGLGKSSIAEGGLGLFTLAGGLVTLGLLAWVKGTALRKGRPYQATLEFPLACGITVGTPVSCLGLGWVGDRKGVPLGSGYRVGSTLIGVLG
jgi:hypothetical protein